VREIDTTDVIPDDIVDFLLELGKTVSKPACNPMLSCLYVNVFLLKEGFAGSDADPVMGAFWMREAAKNGVPRYSLRAR